MAINKKEIMGNNENIEERMVNEKWRVYYDKKSDDLVFGNKFPDNSGFVYLDEKCGFQARVGEDNRIYGFLIENYKSVFLKNNKDKQIVYRLLFIPDSVFFGRLLRIILFVVCLIYILFKSISLGFDYLIDFYKGKYSIIEDELSKVGCY